MSRRKNDEEFIAPYDVWEHKIMKTMDADKRERIIECAMIEFSKGYGVANMDNVVREAGVSKGLLFHYFGSKRGVFLFMLKYALDTINKEYAGLILNEGDFIETIWNVSKLAVELTFKYPVIYRFSLKAYFSIPEVFTEGLPEDVVIAPDAVMKKIYHGIGEQKFKPDIDHEKAKNIILWTVGGFNERILSYGPDIEAYENQYEKCLQELDEYLTLLRKVFYR
jgi:AcrR family transcriptional regulator